MTIVVAVMLGIFGGAMILATAIFFWYLIRTVRDLKASVDYLAKSVEPLMKAGSLQAIAKAAVQSLEIAPQLLVALKSLNGTMSLFNRAFFAKDAAEAVIPTVTTTNEFAGEDESARFGYSEEDAAVREKQETLRRSGIETDPARGGDPRTKNMTGESV